MIVSSGPQEHESTSAALDAATALARSAGEPSLPRMSLDAPPVDSGGPLGYGVTAASAARSAAVCARALADARAPISAVTKVAITTNAHIASPISEAEPRWRAGWRASRSAP